MQSIQVQTRAGHFGFVGRLHTDHRRPALLAIIGAFPNKGYMHELVDLFPENNVLVATMPGFDNPWSDADIATLTLGLEEAVELLLRDLPIVVFGLSTGNLLGFGLKTPNIKRVIALEPFFETAPLWPFIDWGREFMRDNPQNQSVARWFWRTFGIGPDQLENRDYRHLLGKIRVPTDVIVGGAPLMPRRELPHFPSFTSDEDRAALAGNPLVTIHEAGPEAGHSVTLEKSGRDLVLSVLRAAMTERLLQTR